MKLVIYGAGGSGKEAFEILEDCPREKEKWDEVIFIDDTKPEGLFYNCKRLPFHLFQERYAVSETAFVIAVGEPRDRVALYEKVKCSGYEFTNVIHETARISKSAKLGLGLIIQSDVLISSEAVINDNVYINHKAVIGHDSIVEKHCQISCNAVLSGVTYIGEAVFVGIAVCIRDHTRIGEHSILSMGTVVQKDVRPYKIVMGNPGREIRENTEQKVFG